MEKPTGSASLLFILLMVLLSGCAPASTHVPPATETSIPSPTRWSLVVVGDSIAYNSPIACPNCYGFVTRYAHAIEKATGHPVIIQNLSQLGGLQIDGLLEELKTDTYRRDALANADIIIVGIGFNDAPWLRDDDPCDGPNGNKPDWSKYNETCAAAAVEVFRAKLESVYAQIVALREGKPTIFRTINRYNDWIGWTGENGETNPPEATNATCVVVDAWSAMICEAAQVNGFTCADIYYAFNGSDGLTPSGDLLAKDYTHPSDKGNEVITRVLTDLGYAPLAP
jgi:lysophospholipase L1-like esterase